MVPLLLAWRLPCARPQRCVSSSPDRPLSEVPAVIAPTAATRLSLLSGAPSWLGSFPPSGWVPLKEAGFGQLPAAGGVRLQPPSPSGPSSGSLPCNWPLSKPWGEGLAPKAGAGEYLTGEPHLFCLGSSRLVGGGSGWRRGPLGSRRAADFTLQRRAVGWSRSWGRSPRWAQEPSRSVSQRVMGARGRPPHLSRATEGLRVASAPGPGRGKGPQVPSA